MQQHVEVRGHNEVALHVAQDAQVLLRRVDGVDLLAKGRRLGCCNLELLVAEHQHHLARLVHANLPLQKATSALASTFQHGQPFTAHLADEAPGRRLNRVVEHSVVSAQFAHDTSHIKKVLVPPSRL